MMRIFKDFIETGFERRFQRVILEAQQRRSWYVIAAEPGSGKSMGIRDLIHRSEGEKRHDGTTILPLLCVSAPEDDAKATTLCTYMISRFGRAPGMRAAERKLWLVREMARTGVECLVIDDAHALSLQQLIFLKHVTNLLGDPPYERQIGLCLVVAALGGHIPLREVFARQEDSMMQFRRRLGANMSYCRIAGHTKKEVHDILTTFESIYRDQLPDLSLGQWSEACYTWLTHPVLDPQDSQRVVMDHLVKLITLALETSLAQGATNVSPGALKEAAEQLTLRRDDVVVVDDPPEIDSLPPNTERQSDDQQEAS